MDTRLQGRSVSRQTKHALSTFARLRKHALAAGCMLTVRSVSLRGRQNTLCASAVRNNDIMAIFTRGKVCTRAGDEKPMTNSDLTMRIKKPGCHM